MNSNNDRDELGRFVEGNYPKTGFHTNPERRATFPGNRHSISKAAQRLLEMTDTELEAEQNRGDLTQAEQMALLLIEQAKQGGVEGLSAFKQLADRVEGRPSISADINETKVEPPTIVIQGFNSNPDNRPDVC